VPDAAPAGAPAPDGERSFRVAATDPAPPDVERLLRALPEWFGIASAVEEYVQAAARLPTYLATSGATTIGALLVARHFAESAEVHLMAVDRGWHRRGVGRALLAACEDDLVADGVELLQVKTLGPARPDAGYAATRSFYAAVGFRRLEEIVGLWPENPCLVLVKVLQPPGGTRVTGRRDRSSP
jgi:GNAT superfamily N-acetyltransferase